MLTTPRAVVCALAVLVLPMIACEIEAPASDPSSYDGAAATTASSCAPRAPEARAKASRVRADTDSTPGSTLGLPLDTSDDGVLADARPALRAFVAGGETRFLCPSRYRPRTAEGTCTCVSSTDGLTEYPLGDAPCGDGVGRAEGNECVFECPAGRD